MDRIEVGAVSMFREMFLRFDVDRIEDKTIELIGSGCDPKDVLRAAQECIQEVGRKFECGEYYLTELIVAGEMFKKVSDVIKRAAAMENAVAPIGTLVIGTPKGDIHCLGKDIFCVLAEASGLRVHDLGVNVEPEAFLRAVEETGACFLGMSSLLTTTYASMREVVELLETKGLRGRVFVIIGGAATTKEMVANLKVDAQTWDAYEGIRLLTSQAMLTGVRP